MADMEIRNTIKTQLNEKVSETQYDVLHPETHADVVITTTDKQFVSQAEKDKWDGAQAKGLMYFGDWNNSTTYELNSVVYYEGKYFLAIERSLNKVPNETKDTVFWRNINLEAYTADRANEVKVVESSSASTKKII